MNSHIIKKELRESLYSSKGIWMILASVSILSVLCIVIVNIKEGSVLAQSDIMQYLIKASLFIILFVSMVLGASSFTVEREEHTMESILLTPVTKLNLTFAKYTGVIVIGFILSVFSVPYLFAIGYGSGLTLIALLNTFFICMVLLVAFSAISVVLSIIMQTSKAAILTSIFILVVIVSPAFIGSLLKQSAVGVVLMKIDPVSCVFNMMSTAFINKASFLIMPEYFIPPLIFAAVSFMLLVCSSRKIALKGEK